MKIKIQLHNGHEHPEPGEWVNAVFKNPDTGIEFQYPMQWNGSHWVAPRAKEHRGFHCKAKSGVIFLGWYKQI